MSALLDTSVVIDCLRGRADARTFFGSLSSQPAVSVITMAEILAGVRNRHEENDADIFWSIVKPLRIDQDIARRAGVFVRLYRASHSVELADALIAATAEHHGLPLATLNIKHFPMIEGLKAPY